MTKLFKDNQESTEAEQAIFNASLGIGAQLNPTISWQSKQSSSRLITPRTATAGPGFHYFPVDQWISLGNASGVISRQKVFAVRPLELPQLFALSKNSNWLTPVEITQMKAAGTQLPAMEEIEMELAVDSPPIQGVLSPKLRVPAVFAGRLNPFILIPGGWLPAVFLNEKPQLLLDRNVFNDLKALSNNPLTRLDRGANLLDWEDLLSRSSSTQVELFTTLHTWEGFIAHTGGTIETFRQQSRDDAQKLAAAVHHLPNLTVHQPTDEECDYLFELHDNFFSTMVGWKDFLMEAAPLLVAVKKEERDTVKAKLFEAAKTYSLTPHAEVLILALSCLYENQATTLAFARKLIKPNDNYSDANARNALMDLHGMKIGAYFQRDGGPGRIFLASSDVGLCGSWCGLRPFACQQDSDVQSVTDFDKACNLEILFPALQPVQREKLWNEISSLPAQPPINISSKKSGFGY